MKKFIFPALLFLISCSEQAPQEDVVDNSLKITGRIENPDGGDFTIRGPKDFKISSPIAEDSTFSLFFDLEEPGFYTIQYSGERSILYLEQSFNLHISLNPLEFDESLAYQGEGANYNNFLAELYLLDEEFYQNHPSKSRYMRDAAGFAQLADSIQVAKAALADRWALEHHLDSHFVALQKASLDYEKFVTLANYGMGAAYFQEVEEVEIPDDYLLFGENLKLENSEMLGYESYKDFVNKKVAIEAKKILDEMDNPGPIETSSVQLDCINSLLSSQEIKDKFLHQEMKETIQFYGSRDLTELTVKFKKLCKDQTCVEEIEQEIAEWKSLWKGQPAPRFDYTDLEQNRVSLTDFSGKAVYVDVWASWCGPCKREIPFLKDLEHDMHGRNVAFVSISIDEDEEAWRQMVKEKELGGIQLLADSAWRSNICSDYKINGIPRFILIDPEGKIVAADAPRPSSSSEIRALIEEAMTNEKLASME